MKLYEDKIDKALSFLKEPGRLSPTGFSPISYMVYKPEDVMEIRSLTQTVLLPKAKHYGFDVKVVSFGDLINEYISNHKFSFLWADPSIGEKDLYESIRTQMTNDEYLENKILEIQSECLESGETLILFTDVEMLHPFYMIGTIENKIYNNIKIPMLVLYPGETQGTARSFLEIYEQDGNYRSANF